MKNKKTLVDFVIVLAVIVVLVFITIKGKSGETLTNKDVSENKYMENSIEGLKVAVLSEGTGEIATFSNNVSVNYTGYLTDGTVFDSNVDPKFNHVEPFTFTLGVGEVIKGWDEGVKGMKVGEKRIIEISPELAYGTGGVSGVIPPNATLIFEVELLEIIK